MPHSHTPNMLTRIMAMVAHMTPAAHSSQPRGPQPPGRWRPGTRRGWLTAGRELRSGTAQEDVEHAGRRPVTVASSGKPYPSSCRHCERSYPRGRPHRKPPGFVHSAWQFSWTSDHGRPVPGPPSQTCILYQGFAHVPNPFCLCQL